MPVSLDTKANDQSSYVVNVTFEDENGDAVVPNVITWTLTNEDGTVVNSRSDVAVAVPAASVDILLYGDDLKYSDGARRILTVEAVYNSTLGSNIPIKDEVKFKIYDLVNI